jgi:hypothetical protein
MPSARYIEAAADGGPLRGGAPRVVWQSLSADPRAVSARSAAQRLDQLGRPSHLVWNPLTGETVQLISIVRAARSLGCPEGLEPPGPVGDAVPPAGHTDVPSAPADGYLPPVNAEGRLCVQISVVAFPWEPFTEGPMAGLQPILRWLDSWGIPRQWPAGRPAPFPHGHPASGSNRAWSRGGHFGASQVPGWTAAGPGCIDVELLHGRAAAAATLTGARGGTEHAAAPGYVTGPAETGRLGVGLPELDSILPAAAASAALSRAS